MDELIVWSNDKLLIDSKYDHLKLDVLGLQNLSFRILFHMLFSWSDPIFDVLFSLIYFLFVCLLPLYTNITIVFRSICSCWNWKHDMQLKIPISPLYCSPWTWRIHRRENSGCGFITLFDSRCSCGHGHIRNIIFNIEIWNEI